MLPRVLTIAGSDSSGGAGIQADLKTFTVLHAYGMTAITALTAQNTLGVEEIAAVEPSFVGRQIAAVAADIGVDAAKTGMLANRAIIEIVADAIAAHELSLLIVDPVLVAESGASLLEEGAIEALRDRMLPLATVVTPNVPEAEALLGSRVDSIDAMGKAAMQLVECGASAALIKGGHLEGEDSVDVLYDGTTLHELSTPRLETRNVHGTGCILSAALTVYLARGIGLLDAVGGAKGFVRDAIASGLDLGRGPGPANVLHDVTYEDPDS